MSAFVLPTISAAASKRSRIALHSKTTKLLTTCSWTTTTRSSSSCPTPRMSLVVGLSTARCLPCTSMNDWMLSFQKRWKHQAKMGQHLARLDEMAHEKSHQEAQEKRQKKKEKKAARKAKKGRATSEEESNPLSNQDAEEVFDEEEEEEETDELEQDETVLPDPKQVKERMQDIVSRFEESLKAIRGAEPTVELFDDVQVDAYGSNTSLQSVAQVVISSPTLATATCFDPAVAKAASNAIRNQLSLNPSVEEGGVIKIPLPRVSLETRQQTAKALGKRAESYRQRIRKVRRNVMDVVKKGVAGRLEGISKDDAFRVQKEIEAATEDVLHTLNQAAEKKHNSIMAV